jgi:hypothetical protein
VNSGSRPRARGRDPRFTNVLGDKHFDQIAFHDPKRRLKASKGGVFDFQQVIYGPNDAEKYRSAMERSAPDKFATASASAKALEKFYRQWRTFQVSDHLPLWVELKTDFADNYLASVMRGKISSRAATRARKEAEATSPVVTPPPIADMPPEPPTSPARKSRARAKKKGGAKKASRKAA